MVQQDRVGRHRHLGATPANVAARELRPGLSGMHAVLMPGAANIKFLPVALPSANDGDLAGIVPDPVERQDAIGRNMNFPTAPADQAAVESVADFARMNAALMIRVANKHVIAAFA